MHTAVVSVAMPPDLMMDFCLDWIYTKNEVEKKEILWAEREETWRSTAGRKLIEEERRDR